jgi:hypothetical protein
MTKTIGNPKTKNNVRKTINAASAINQPLPTWIIEFMNYYSTLDMSPTIRLNADCKPAHEVEPIKN